MSDSIPVAGVLVTPSDQDELLVVEAEPESEATRAHKGIARHVYRFAQEVQWAGSERAVAVRIQGDGLVAASLAVNLALLLAPLLDIAIEAVPEIEAAFAAELDDRDPPSPRDRLWLVGGDELGGLEAAERYDMTIGVAESAGLVGADLVLVIVEGSAARVRVPDVDPLTEVAAVILGPLHGDPPHQLEVG